jgi:CheY-like chemotaxis protein
MRILIAETDLTLLHKMKRALEGVGYQVSISNNGMGAWGYLASANPPDLLITRLRLGAGAPPDTALGLHAQLAHTPRIPVIYVPLNAERAKLADPEHGAILVKPFAMSELGGECPIARAAADAFDVGGAPAVNRVRLDFMILFGTRGAMAERTSHLPYHPAAISRAWSSAPCSFARCLSHRVSSASAPIERGTGDCNFFSLGVMGSFGRFERSLSLRERLAAALTLRFLSSLLGVRERRFCSVAYAIAASRGAPSSSLGGGGAAGDFGALFLCVLFTSVAGRSLEKAACWLKRASVPTARRRTTPGLAIVAAMIAGSSASFANP